MLPSGFRTPYTACVVEAKPEWPHGCSERGDSWSARALLIKAQVKMVESIWKSAWLVNYNIYLLYDPAVQ